MLEVGQLLEGSSLHPFAPQNALVEASPCSELSPDTAVTPVGMRVLAIPSAPHIRQLEPVVELTAFKGLFLLEKPVRCQPRAGIWVPNTPRGREHPPVSLAWEGVAAHPTLICSPFPWERRPSNPNTTKSRAFSQRGTCAHPLQWGSAGNVTQTAPR